MVHKKYCYLYKEIGKFLVPVKSKVEIITTDQGNSSIIIMFTNALNDSFTQY